MSIQTITKLSQAIREGAKLRPQATGTYFKNDPDLGVTSCAIGAAYEALTNESTPGIHGCSAYIANNLLGAGYLQVWNPITNTEDELFEVITQLNDVYYWTRESIADFLEERGY